MIALNRAVRFTAEQVAAAILASDNEHNKYSSPSDEFSSEENSIEHFIDEDGDTHSFNRAMIIGIQFVPEPSGRGSLLIDSVGCYIFA